MPTAPSPSAPSHQVHEPAVHDEAAPGEALAPEPQLTLRALVWGGVLGCVLGVSNLYLGLQMGGAVSVGITACLIALPAQRLLVRLAPRLFGRQLSLLEGCVLQTTASGAGFAVVSSLPSVVVAWLLTQEQPIPRETLLLWTLCTSLLGAFFGLALQRRFLQREGLSFPSSVGVATTLRAVHSRQGSAPQVRAMAIASGAVSLLAMVRDVVRWGPAQVIPAGPLLLVAVGALMGLRLAVSMLLGAVLCHGLLVPVLVDAGLLASADPYQAIIHTAVPGTVLLASSALVRVLYQGWLLVGARARSEAAHEARPADSSLELLPRAGSWWGMGVLSVASIWVAWQGFGVPWYQGLLAVGLSLALTALAIRIVGETGLPPAPEVNQLACGLLIRGGFSAQLAHSGLAFNSSAVGTDLLVNLKAGQVLGAGARQQFMAHVTGCILGVLVLVPVFYLLVPDVSSLAVAGGRFAAPAGEQVKALAEMLNHGLRGMSSVDQWSVLLAAVTGGVLAMAELLLPGRLARFVPSPIGMGLAFLLGPIVPLCVSVGGLVAWAVTRRRPEAAEQWVLPAACGVVAVESLVLALQQVLGSGQSP